MALSEEKVPIEYFVSISTYFLLIFDCWWLFTTQHNVDDTAGGGKHMTPVRWFNFIFISDLEVLVTQQLKPEGAH